MLKLRHSITLNLETLALWRIQKHCSQYYPILSSPQGALEMNIDTDTSAAKTISISVAFCLLLPEEVSVEVN